MQFRPRQQLFMDRVCAALDEHGNTLGVAPTGFGKTVAMAGIAGRRHKGPGLILQHRDELVNQNCAAFLKVNKGAQASLWTADRKRWARDGWTFGMIQSVANGLDSIPKMGSIIVDEGHHAVSDTYLKVIGHILRENPACELFLLTATPVRGDKRSLKTNVNNIADVVTLRETIEAGYLVKPRTFVVDVGVTEQLRGVRKLTTDFDMDAVAEIMDRKMVTDKVIAEWKEKAGNLQTVVFAANVEHAKHVAEAFVAAGVKTVAIYGTMKPPERTAAFAAFDGFRAQVLVNVAVATEGWDCQPAACCVLLRPSSFKSTMQQMIGRVLRTVDPERYPGVIKNEAVILDFGTSILTHGDIETDGVFGEGRVVDCPQCAARVPGCCPECPLCGYAFPKELPKIETKTCTGCGHENAPNRRLCSQCGMILSEPKVKSDITDFVLTEVDLFQSSPFRWEELWAGIAYVCSSFEAWSAVVHYKGAWFAVGGSKEHGIKCLAAGAERLVALAAGDDHMRENGSTKEAGKNKRWLSEPPTDKQLQALGLSGMEAVGITRYRAGCLMTWKWAEKAIQAKIVASAGSVQHGPA